MDCLRTQHSHIPFSKLMAFMYQKQASRGLSAIPELGYFSLSYGRETARRLLRLFVMIRPTLSCGINYRQYVLFVIKHACDRRTDGQTELRSLRAHMHSCVPTNGWNLKSTPFTVIINGRLSNYRPISLTYFTIKLLQSEIIVFFSFVSRTLYSLYSICYYHFMSMWM